MNPCLLEMAVEDYTYLNLGPRGKCTPFAKYNRIHCTRCGQWHQRERGSKFLAVLLCLRVIKLPGCCEVPEINQTLANTLRPTHFHAPVKLITSRVHLMHFLHDSLATVIVAFLIETALKTDYYYYYCY